MRHFTKLLAAAAASLILTACAGASGPTPATPGAAKPSVEKGITYAPSGQKLDICRPADKSARQTAIVFIHGGGFVSGHRRDMGNFCELYSQGGFTAVTIGYRLAQSAAYPAAVEDVDAAILWLKQNAAREGIDPARIALVGYSAGGSLALMGGQTPETEIAARISVAGISDFQRAYDETPHAALKRDLDKFLAGTSKSAVSPASMIAAGDAPIFLFHGKADNLVPVSQSVLMAEAAKAKDVKVLLRVFDNVGHEIMLKGPQMKPLLDDMTAFLVAVDEAP